MTSTEFEVNDDAEAAMTPPTDPAIAQLLTVSGPQAAGLGVRGRFHSHVTVHLGDPDEAGDTDAALARLRDLCQSRKVKLTVIDLARGDRRQRDVMTTCYHRHDGDDAVARIVEEMAALGRALSGAGFPVLRFKLEHESLPTLRRFTPERYREIHVKLSLPEADADTRLARLAELAPALGVVPSRNPLERRAGRVIQFVNLRIYDGDLAACERRVDGVVAALEADGFTVLQVKRETTVLDTRRAHDAWWA